MEWLNRKLFPFATHTYTSRDGLIRYVDVGSGPVLLFVHGTPTWSLLWRHAIAKFASTHRVIAIDHLGFGLSEKPTEVDYSLSAHSARFREFVDYLGIQDITLIVHDFGGPIALSDVINRPGLYKKLVLCNTFLWPFAGEFVVPTTVSLLNGRVGKFLYLNLNMSPQWLLPAVFANRQNLDATVHQQYVAPFADSNHRQALWAMVHELTPDNPWLAQCWAQREHLTKIPTLLLWGTRDPIFGAIYLQRWQQLFHHVQICTYHDAGHFVQEEASFDYVKQIQSFIA
jgi:haloalkane dehalogenase